MLQSSSPANRPAVLPSQPAIVASMADWLRSRSASTGGITREDLLLDFSAEEIDRNFEEARKKARAAGRARR